MSVLGTRNRRTTALLAAGIAVVAVGGGLAYAYWTGTGTGTGQATTGAAANFTVTSELPSGPPLTPGGALQVVAFTVSNPGTGTQHLSSVVVTVANPDGTDWVATPGCSAADYTVGSPNIAYDDITAGANLAGTVTVTMNNLETNQDACQSADAPLYIVAS